MPLDIPSAKRSSYRAISSRLDIGFAQGLIECFLQVKKSRIYRLIPISRGFLSFWSN